VSRTDSIRFHSRGPSLPFSLVFVIMHWNHQFVHRGHTCLSNSLTFVDLSRTLLREFWDGYWDGYWDCWTLHFTL